jgi:long-chain acyl-CoA synthetase
MYTGMQVFYAESLTTFVVDLNRCEPTLFLSVPRLWTKFQGGVLSKLPASKLDFMLKIPLINILIKKKVRTPSYYSRSSLVLFLSLAISFLST